MATYTFAILVVGVIIAAYTDLRSRRIPNSLTGTLAVSAIVFSSFGGWTSVATAALVMLFVFLSGTVAFSLGWFGGGDVKLMTACSGLVGYPGFVSLVLYTLVAGGLVALVEAAKNRRFRTVVVGVYRTTQGFAPTEGAKIPYGIAIALGACSYALSTIPAFSFLRLPL